jgi:tetratricopeptide (TPR) repeat protein
VSDQIDLELEEHLSTFLTTNIAGKRRVLEQHGGVLLTEKAERRLQDYVDRARKLRQSNLAAYEVHLRLLSECRQYGIDAALGVRERARQLIQDDDTRALAQQAAVLMEEGPDGKDQIELERATALIRRMLVVIGQIAPSRAVIEVTHSLGNYLAALGNRSGDLNYYHEALTEFRSALALTPAVPMSVDRGKCLASLGQCHWALGRLTGGRDHLISAVTALREAASVLDRPETHAEWVTVVASLANALTPLGEAIGSQESLEEGIDLHRTAIMETSRADNPLTWALYKANLANALRTLGHQFKLVHALDGAIVAAEESLEERPLERVPERWADSKAILGSALENRGDLSRSLRDLGGAVGTLRDALQVHTRERHPRHWADSQHNLGNTLLSIGNLKKDRVAIEESIAAFRSALLERTLEKRPRDWAMSTNDLAIALRHLGTLTGEAQYFEQAAAAYRAALTVRTPDRDPLGHLETMRSLVVAQGAQRAWADTLKTAYELLEVAKIISLGETDRATQRRLLATLSGLGDQIAYAHLKEGRPNDAVQGVLAARAVAAENSRISERAGNFPELKSAWLLWQAAREVADSTPSAEAFSAVRATYHRLRAVYDANVHDELVTTVNLAVLRRSIPQNGALVIVIIGPEGGAALTVTTSPETPSILWLSQLTRESTYELFHNQTWGGQPGWLDEYQRFGSAIDRGLFSPKFFSIASRKYQINRILPS